MAVSAVHAESHTSPHVGTHTYTLLLGTHTHHPTLYTQGLHRQKDSLSVTPWNIPKDQLRFIWVKYKQCPLKRSLASYDPRSHSS